ncbi:hypothetical protein JTB14_035372 [Gonioctena quinquepunctata]|nr:hypothetical protein JTB14_035372 [Gonioctena quinquepunctata]
MKTDFDDRVKELHTVNEEQKNENEKLKNRLQTIERRTKKYILVFYGLKEQGETYGELVGVIQNKLNININTINIREAHRIGKEGPKKIRPVLVEFINSQKKYEILHNANKLKNSGISKSVDVIAEDYEEKQFMLKQLTTARQKQFNAKHKGNNLLINDTEYPCENLKQNPVENWTVKNGTEKENSSRKRTNEI